MLRRDVAGRSRRPSPTLPNGGPSRSSRAASRATLSESKRDSVGPDPYLGTVLAGRYRVNKALGAGGMGVVYRAEHVHMKKAVAVKILHKHMTAMPEVVARFEREAVAAGRIEHPNVAGATDFGRLDDGSFYLALEYIEGKSLSSLLEGGGALPEVRALVITRQIADGLAAAHAAGIIHRDLKPENVMLVERDGVPDYVKVLDFGIAKVPVEEAEGQKLTQIGTIFGTPQYMSPEQGQGHTVDARADLYALGVMLYEMLAGKLPFFGDEMVVLITRHILEAPPPLPDGIHPGVQGPRVRVAREGASASHPVGDRARRAHRPAAQEIPPSLPWARCRRRRFLRDHRAASRTPRRRSASRPTLRSPPDRRAGSSKRVRRRVYPRGSAASIARSSAPCASAARSCRAMRSSARCASRCSRRWSFSLRGAAGRRERWRSPPP